MTEVYADVCARCESPVIQREDGTWAHAEYADEVFCLFVMGGDASE